MKKLIATGLTLILIPYILLSLNIRIKDLARFKGDRPNQLMGYSIVVGLAGSGDSTRNIMSNRSIANALKDFGFNINSADIKSKNIAAVMVTAKLPAFSRAGDKIDVEVSSIGDAKDLSGGVLLQTPLYAANGKIYAAAQGKLTEGGVNAPSPKDRFLRHRKSLSAKIIAGGIVEQDVPSEIVRNNEVALIINNPDITTANNIKNALVSDLGVIAQIVDPGYIRISVPQQYMNDPYTFLSKIENTEVALSKKAKVIVNEKTGAVVIGGDVRISECAVAYNDLYLTVKGAIGAEGEQKNYIEKAKTKQKEQSMLGADRVVRFKDSPNIQAIVAALNSMGATPKDVIGILTAIYEAGALNASLEVK